jgi:uncharacterized protein
MARYPDQLPLRCKGRNRILIPAPAGFFFGAIPMQFTDAVTVAGTRRTKDGYLVADVRCARTGVQSYRGAELGMNDRETVSVYRPASEVFSRDSKVSFAHKPVTIGHPPEPVTSDNWKRYAVGDVGDEIIEDGNYIRVPLKLMDASAIARVSAGEREISMGYSANIEFADGVTPEGERYDAIMKDIRINHLAIVPKGRAGSECRVGDSADNWGATPQHKEPTMTTKIVVDGVTLASLEDAAAAVASLQAKVKDAETKAAELADAHARAVSAKDGELAAKDATIADLKKTIEAADASLDDRIAERQSLIDAASKVAGKAIEAKGKTNDAIRREAVAIRLGDEAVKDKDAAYVVAAFDTLANVASALPGKDPLRAALSDASASAGDDLEKSRRERLARLNDGWKVDGKTA